MTKNYSELVGGLGRKIYFRSERYLAKDVLELVKPVLTVDDENFAIFDMSMNGIAFRAGDRPFEVGQSLRLTLELGDVTTYDGAGRVSRVERHPRGLKVGVSLEQGFLDIPKIVATHDLLALQMEMEAGAAGALEGISLEYRQVCADVVHLCRHYRSVLDRYQKRATNGVSRIVKPEQFFAHCEKLFRKEWDELRARANALVNELDGNVAAIEATKKFTEKVVTPEFLYAPNWKRCYEKPLGYPGDFGIMNFLYSGERHGQSAYAELVHQFGLDQPIAACVPHRMRMLRDAIAESIRTTDPAEDPVRVISLACGPAREIEESLKLQFPSRRVHFLLIDQDEHALSYAHDRILRETSDKNGNVTAECLYISFAQLFKNAELLMSLPQQHLIYSAGLFDYLNEKRSQMLVGGLYSKLAKGGSLLVGNMKAPTDAKWSIEYILDWPLIYRTEDEMRRLASLVPSKDLEVRADPTGYAYLLQIRHP